MIFDKLGKYGEKNKGEYYAKAILVEESEGLSAKKNMKQERRK